MSRYVSFRGMILVFVAVGILTCFSGCGNVTLRGDALTAAETSVMDAYQAVHRSGAIDAQRAGTTLTWEQAYFVQNFQQWRYFVRSDRANPSWGPTLPNERAGE